MAKTRTTHVRRIKNADDEEIWIDVERADRIVNNQEGQGGLYRKTTRIMDWGDESSDEPHPTRETTELRVEQPDDPDTFVLINVIDKQKTRRDQGLNYKKTHKWFVNDKETNTVREVSFRRVFHWDTETDPNDDGGTEYVRIEGTEDRSQYLDVAVIEKLIQRRGQGLGYKQRTYQFNTDPIKEFSEPSPEDVDPATVVWLDPWQNIVNVKWQPPLEFVSFIISLDEEWAYTPEYVSTGGSCSPNLGLIEGFWSKESLIKAEITDFDSGPPTGVTGHYRGGEWIGGISDGITGLEYPFPKSVGLAPWQFVGATVSPPIPQWHIEWEEATGDIITDREGDPVQAFDGEDTPFRRGDSATLKALGVMFISGPACHTRFGPGGSIPLMVAVTESHGPNEHPTEIPGVGETISISAISVEVEGVTFVGAGFFAVGPSLHIICERVDPV